MKSEEIETVQTVVRKIAAERECLESEVIIDAVVLYRHCREVWRKSGSVVIKLPCRHDREIVPH
jgi:hypothetical protein